VLGYCAAKGTSPTLSAKQLKKWIQCDDDFGTPAGVTKACEDAEVAVATSAGSGDAYGKVNRLLHYPLTFPEFSPHA
jgi:hypothetical protein